MSRENSLTSSERVNQKARTRTALLKAATELVREGRPASIPDAAERALISVATAYRYFASAEDLWWEASMEAVTLAPLIAQVDARIAAAGDDAEARLEAWIRNQGFHMLEDQVPYRRIAKAALDRWFAQLEAPEGETVPVREGRREKYIAMILEPLGGRVSKKDLQRIARALSIVVGIDAMLALTDGVHLSVPEAKKAMLDASRWLLAGALADIGDK
jgi:AcrR family transcriptional regulator